MTFGRKTMGGMAVVLALVAAACGGSSSSDLTAVPTMPPTTSGGVDETTTTTEPVDAGDDLLVTSLDGVQNATIQIIAQGTLRDPEVGLSFSGGSGSGFFISDDGLAVTNNHVVTGAATLEVFIGGDTSRGYNATVLGVSECNDLALIRVNAPGPTSYLTWYEDDIRPGIDVYAAGFPLGDPEFTLTRGIVAKARADGDITGTSSIDFTVEHDANIQPGNSGGPLVTANGQVVAVNYAGAWGGRITTQFFAISAELARPVVDVLETADLESLGINGWAVYDESIGISGIWVAGVAAGSPAAQARILPGDIITLMNGLPMGMDGTFKDYCDVLRTAGSRAIAVEVLRWDTSEVLTGEINGTVPLEVTFSFAQELEEQTDLEAGEAYSGYQTVTDALGAITVQVPNEWSDVDTEAFPLEDGSLVPYIGASPDLQSFFSSYNTPGVELVTLSMDQLGGMTTDDLLGRFAPAEGGCTFDNSGAYEDPIFQGVYDLWVDCGGTGTIYAVLVAYPIADDGSAFVMVFQAVTDADLDVLQRVLDTFNYV